MNAIKTNAIPPFVSAPLLAHIWSTLNFALFRDCLPNAGWCNYELFL